MEGPSKKMHVSNEVLHDLLKENEYSGISESEYDTGSDINVKISLGGEQTAALMKQKTSAITLACNLTYKQIQVLSNHIFH
jgi:hypothetical protein